MSVPDPQVLPGEHTKLQWKVASTYVDVAQLLAVKFPGGAVESVSTTGLAAAAKTYRPGLIPEVGEVTFKINFDPNHTDHRSLASRVVTPAIDDWKIIYVDGNTTPANDQFFGFITKFELNEVEGESSVNVEADITIQVTGIVTRTAGSGS